MALFLLTLCSPSHLYLGEFDYFWGAMAGKTLQRLNHLLFDPIPNGQLVLFRVAFGFLLAAETFGAILTGWVKETFVTPTFTFTFMGFEWLQFLLGPTMYGYYAIMGILGLMVMVGLYYRWSLGLYTIMWAFSFWLQKSHYNNHYYLLMLLGLWMLLTPAHRAFSLDVKRNPKLKSDTCPGWCRWFIIVQLFIVYTFAGFSKIYPDWLNGSPMSVWFASKSHFWLVGDILQQSWLHIMVIWGGIFYDCLIVPALLYRPTRILATVASFGFHLFNAVIFHIGIFPFLMLATLVFFYPPALVQKQFFGGNVAKAPIDGTPVWNTATRRLVLIGFACYFSWQILIPLRYHLYPGNVHWTEEGHRLSWKMMLRTKTGHVQFWAKLDDELTLIDHQQYLQPHQIRRLAFKPDMIWQFSQFLKKDFKQKGHEQVEIYATSMVSLNGAPLAPMIDSSVNLAEIEWEPFKHAAWIFLDNQEEQP